MSKSPSDELTRKIARIHSRVLAVVLAVIFGLSLFSMTVWLVIKDGEDPGRHLELLQNYFVGYSVTWTGSFVGLVYGALLGALVGWLIGTIYNWIASAPRGS